MSAWTIYFADGETISGETAEEWRAASDEGVQAVVFWEVPHWTERPWSGVSDRKIWTGEDEYLLYGWPKKGSLIGDAEYAMIAHRAFYGPRP